MSLTLQRIGTWAGHQSDSTRPDRVWSHANVLVVTVIALTFVICPTRCNAQSRVDEYRVKAAFLFHFAQFVEWPPEALDKASESFVLCIVGNDPFHGDLEDTIHGKTIDARPIRVRHVKQIQESQGCNVLFIGRDGGSSISQQMSTLGKAPILTVGESDDFLQQGGMIRLFVEDRKVRFEINRVAAETANLRVSSRLLLLAKTEIGGGRR